MAWEYNLTPATEHYLHLKFPIRGFTLKTINERIIFSKLFIKGLTTKIFDGIGYIKTFGSKDLTSKHLTKDLQTNPYLTKFTIKTWLKGLTFKTLLQLHNALLYNNLV